MGFYVATNRQKAPENAFQMRARLKAEAEAKAAEAAKIREPADVADQMPDLAALREAAAHALALVHAPEPGTATRTFEELQNDVDQASKVDTDNTDLGGVSGTEEHPEVVDDVLVTPRSEKRADTVLRMISEAGDQGIGKKEIAAKLGEKEANVYTSLKRLQGDGKVELRHMGKDRGYLWFAS